MRTTIDRFDEATRAMIVANQANWDARVPTHIGSAFYGLHDTASRHWFAPFEWADLGDLSGLDVIHLQCHLGTETVEFAARGAETVGLDFSGEALAEARRIAERAGRCVTYVHANVYDAVRAVGGRRFDVVYTGKGALCYLPDLAGWAGEVHDLLKPGGRLYLVEFHPVLTALGWEPPPDGDPELVLRSDYLGGRGAQHVDGQYTYTDGPALSAATDVFEWAHGLGEVVEVLVGAGFTVRGLRESGLLPWPRWEFMEQTADGWWRLPDSAPRLPLTYALTAVKP